MSVFGDIVKESRYIDDKVYVSFDEENYRRLELKLKMQEQEIERLQRQKEELQVNGLRQETLFKLEIERLKKELQEEIEEKEHYQAIVESWE